MSLAAATALRTLEYRVGYSGHRGGALRVCATLVPSLPRSAPLERVVVAISGLRSCEVKNPDIAYAYVGDLTDSICDRETVRRVGWRLSFEAEGDVEHFLSSFVEYSPSLTERDSITRQQEGPPTWVLTWKGRDW